MIKRAFVFTVIAAAGIWAIAIFHRFYAIDPVRQKLVYGAAIGLAALLWWALPRRMTCLFWLWVPFPVGGGTLLLCFHPIAVLAAGALGIVSFAAGRSLLGWLKVPRFQGGAYPIHLLAVGMTLCSCGVFVVGLAHGLNAPVLWLLALLCGWLAFRRGQLWSEGVRAGACVVARLKKASGMEWLAIWLISIVAAVIFVRAVAPPYLSDDLVYHMGLPAIFVRHGAVSNLPFYTHFNAPLGAEMLYASTMAMGSEHVGAGLINFGYALLLLGAFVTLGLRLGGVAVGLFAWIGFFSVPYYSIVASSGSADLKHLLYFFLALDAFLRWRDDRDKGTLLLCAVEAGFALHYRYHGIILFVALSVGVWWLARRQAVRIAPLWLSFAGCFAVAGGWWLARNWVETGNPFFPTSTGFYDGFRGDPELSELWRSYGNPASPWLFGGYGFGMGWYNYFSLPWRVTFLGPGFEGYEFTPLFLGLLPLIVWSFFRRGIAVLLGALALYYATAWFFQMHQLKFLIPAIGLVALLGAGAVFNWGQQHGRLAMAVFVAISMTPLLCTLNIFWRYGWADLGEAVHATVNQAAREAYLEKRVPLYPMLREINRDSSLPKNFRVFTWEDQGLFYLHREFILGHPQNQLVADYRTMPDFAAFLARMKDIGVTHLLFHPGQKPAVDHLVGAPHAALALLLDKLDYRLLKEVRRQDGLVLYEISYPPDLVPYYPNQHVDRVQLGEVLAEYGMLDRAREQYVLAGAAGGTAREKIDAMSHAARGDFYLRKARQHRHQMFLKPALDEFAAAAASLTPGEKARGESGMKEVRDFANQLVGHIWGRLPDTKWLVAR